MGRKARKRKREKKQIAEAEQKAEEERKKAGLASDIFEDTDGRPLRKKPRLEVRREARMKVEDICLSWATPAPKRESMKRPKTKPTDPLKDLWASEPPKEKPPSCRAPKNKTVNLKPKTFDPQSFQSVNPAPEDREAGLDKVGKHWEKYDGKRIKDAKAREAEIKAARERLAEAEAKEAQEAFLQDEGESSSPEEDEGKTEEAGKKKLPEWSRLRKKTPKQRAKQRAHKERLREIAAKKKLKQLSSEFSKIRTLKKQLDDHAKEVAERPKKVKKVPRRSANSKKFEPTLPLLLTKEEVEKTQGTLRKAPAHPDLLHDVVNKLEEKRVLNPRRRKRGSKKRKVKITKQIRIGSGRGVHIDNLRKAIDKADKSEQAKKKKAAARAAGKLGPELPEREKKGPKLSTSLQAACNRVLTRA